jgi:3-hydroxyisobutyrate dehydrogenase
MTKIAFLGTGIMGLPMAANLADAGFEVRAWNRTRAKAEPLVAHGAQVVDSPRDAVAGADIVVTMLADGPAVDSVIADAGLASGQVWLQMSTVGIEWTARLASVAEKAGVAFVDAPVLGTKQPAEQGKLLVLASGPEEVRDVAAQVFDVVGERTLWVGEAGAGTRLKLVANSWVLTLVNGTAEAIGLAGALGLDPTSFLDVIRGGGLDSPYAQMKGAAMIKGDFTPSFPARLARKDADLVLEAGDDAVDLAGIQGARAHLDAVVAAGFGDDDLSVVYRAVVK